jgi:hypothetical protein
LNIRTSTLVVKRFRTRENQLDFGTPSPTRPNFDSTRARCVNYKSSQAQVMESFTMQADSLSNDEESIKILKRIDQNVEKSNHYLCSIDLSL